MRFKDGLMLGGCILMMVGCGEVGGKSESAPPRAAARPKTLEAHGHTRIDPYYWMKEREDPEVVAYLEAENQYTEEVMGHAKKFEVALFEEIKSRIKKDDTSVPYKQDDYFYYSRYETDSEYPLHCRKPGSLEADEQIMLNVNEIAEGHEFFQVGRRAISSGQDLLAYAVDTVGRRIYTIQFKNLETGKILEDTIPEVTGNMAWANDNKTLFYTKQDPTTLRSYRIYRHELGSDPAQDKLIYEEKDDTFGTFVFKTKSKAYLMIGSYQTLSSEYRYLDANKPLGDFKIVLPRARDHEYGVDHFGNDFYIRTNKQAKNFRLVKAPVKNPSRWTEVIGNRDDVLLGGFEIFQNFLVVEERKDGLVDLRVRPWSGEQEHYLDFGEPAYLSYISTNLDFDTKILRYGYTSMTTPNSTFDYDMISREKTLLKREEILGDFDPANYKTERLSATATDGTKVPISLVYRKGVERNGENPLVLYGYGSYGLSMDATFSSPRLSLLDRGFVYAIAHIRGGEEMGRTWYEDGKLLKKKNTFTDFIDCAEFLTAEKFSNPKRMFAMGGSAGGLLVGAVVNMRPDIFHGAVAAVPFVDVVTTMLDDSIPLTTGEFDEWGDPNQKEYYDYILSYSPYDNVEAKDYPHLLVTTGLHDSQVQYWEPAKWVAKLRELKTDGNRLLLKTNLDAGHGGASGRFKRYEDLAFRYAFILDLAGIHS